MPPENRAIRANEDLLLASTRAGLAEVLELARTSGSQSL
jgi:hypothetical protein